MLGKAIGKEFRASVAVTNSGFAKAIGKNLDLEVTKYGKNEKYMRLPEAYSRPKKKYKSGDLVTLLNENGFEVKGANSNIEDEAIDF